MVKLKENDIHEENVTYLLTKIYKRLGWILFWIIFLGFAIGSNTY